MPFADAQEPSTVYHLPPTESSNQALSNQHRASSIEHPETD
jgi:hypothetical protein